jgi:hypothetical protein
LGIKRRSGMSNSEIKYMACDASKPIPPPQLPASVDSVAEEAMLFLLDIVKKSRITNDAVREKLQYVMVDSDALNALEYPERKQEYPKYFIEIRMCLEDIYANLEAINHFIHRASL